MRSLLLVLLLSSATAASVKGMSVVVYTSDRVVVDYVCTERRALGSRDAVRRVVQAPGRFNWHVVNGKAPYHVMDQYTDEAGNVCITVMDALGNLASGCGIIAERHVVANVTCPPQRTEEPTTLSTTPVKPGPPAVRAGHTALVVRQRARISTKQPDRGSNPDRRPPAPTRTVYTKDPDGQRARRVPLMSVSGR